MSASKKPKLARLPQNAKISKRPLVRGPLASPYASADSHKVVYVSSRTPFMSAVKRVEKLLRLADKRLIQSATTLAKDKQYRKRKRGNGEGDDIEAIVDVAEEQKRVQKRKRTNGEVTNSSAGEEVVVKGTGKAIAKVMDLGLWFQQREEEYFVGLVTASTNSIDDVEYEKDIDKVPGDDVGERDAMDLDEPHGTDTIKAESNDAPEKEFVSEARIRKVSVLEVHVSLR